MTQSLERNLDSGGDWSWRSNRYAWWVAFVLTLSMMLSMVDRMIIALMVEPIKVDFALTDTHIGLLHGLAFTMLYVVMGLPLGWLVDRKSRRAIAAISLLAWSVMTGLCGLAASYSQLFLARVGVGIGEAGMSPAAASLISDYFPASRRAAPLLCLTLGTALGGGIALIFGGLVMHLIGGTPVIDVPIFGPTRSWQFVFLLLGAMGIVYSVVFVTVREPPRQERLASRELTLREITAYLASRRPILLYHFVGVGGAALVLMAMNLWIPSFLIRTLGWDRVTVGWGYGALLVSASVVGVVIAGIVTSRLQRTGRRDAALRVSFWAVIVAMLPLLVAPLLRLPQLVMPLLFVGMVSLT
ncbi:MAG: MFS transporter, partial [Pseudomonadota bacterium]|nr:MFS transporter [Pseudomonadota bacterium]